MKRILLLLLSIMMCVHMMDAQSEREIATRWLIEKGVAKNTFTLTATKQFDEFVLYEDVKHRLFVMVAKEAYSGCLNNRVLAYSTTTLFSNSEASWSDNLITSYRQQLRAIQEKGITADDTSFTLGNVSMKGKVAPLLNTTWGQFYPYNNDCPGALVSSGHKLTGCVSIALSQIMYYYRYPQKGNGTFSYSWGKKRVEKTYESLKIDWANISPSYSMAPVAGENTNAVSQLVYANSVALGSQFGDVETPAAIDYVPSVLINVWGYSPKCVVRSDQSAIKIEKTIRAELAAKRPVMLSGGGHAYIADGCEEQYIHFNLGWYGQGNGYYRMLLNPALSGGGSISRIATYIVYGIKPSVLDERVEKDVYVGVPGTLEHLLPGNAMNTVGKLRVRGTLNGKDMLFIRRMSGAYDERHPDQSLGVLRTLDLSDAAFVTDKDNAVCRFAADNCYYELTGLFGTSSFKFSEMTPDQFRKFRMSNMASGTGYKFVEENGKYYVNYYTVAKTISPMLFWGCENLHEVVLPSKTTKVLGRAFYQCNSLEEVILPPAVTEIETGSFAQCYRLRRVVVTNSKVKEIMHGLSPVKTFGQYGVIREGKHCGILAENDANTCEGIFYDDKKNVVKLNELDHKDILK